MARSLNDIIAALPADEQAAIESRYQELKQEVEGLRELRQIAGKAGFDKLVKSLDAAYYEAYGLLAERNGKAQAGGEEKTSIPMEPNGGQRHS